MSVPAAADEPVTESIDLDSEHPEEDVEEIVEHRECVSMGDSFDLCLLLYSASPIIDLPEVGIFWQPEYSTKVPVSLEPIGFLVILLIIRDFRLKIGKPNLGC